MKRTVFVMLICTATLRASDQGGPARDFFRAIISAGGFKDGCLIQTTQYNQGKLFLRYEGVEGNSGTVEFESYRLQPCYAQRLCKFCKEVLAQPEQGAQFRKVLTEEFKDNGEDQLRKQDRLLKSLVEAWKRYNFPNPL